MLSLSDINLSYGPTPILKSVNLTLQPGQVMVVLGPNGAGKSSLLKVACGEVAPQSGSVAFNHQLMAELAVTEKALHMAVLPQQSLLNFPYRVDEVVALGRTPHNTGFVKDGAIVEAALKSMDVHYLREHIYTTLSGGERQRVQMARVLAQVWEQEDSQQRLVVLDEPTSALDYAHQQLVATVLRERAATGCSVLTAMHDLNLAAQCADQLVLMCCGEIRAQGTPEDVLREDLLREVFEVEFHRVTHPKTGRPWLIS